MPTPDRPGRQVRELFRCRSIPLCVWPCGCGGRSETEPGAAGGRPGPSGASIINSSLFVGVSSAAGCPEAGRSRRWPPRCAPGGSAGPASPRSAAPSRTPPAISGDIFPYLGTSYYFLLRDFFRASAGRFGRRVHTPQVDGPRSAPVWNSPARHTRGQRFRWPRGFQRGKQVALLQGLANRTARNRGRRSLRSLCRGWP